MPTPNPLRRWVSPLASENRSRSRSRGVRPRLEALEGRIVLAHNITIATGGLTAIPVGATTFSDTGDYTIAPSALDSVASGTITLRANNDIVVNNNIHLAASVGLNLLAGRNLTLNTEINFFLAPVSLTANAATSLGVNQANRDPGDAALTLSNALLNSSTSNTATLIGDVGDQAGANLHPNAPVLLLGTTEFINSGAFIFGRGNASEPVGVRIDPDAVITASGDFDINLTGTAFNGNQAFNPAVNILGTVETVDGDTTITGNGRGTGGASFGINVGGPSGRVAATGTGNVTLNGTGGSGSGSFGIELAGASLRKTVETKDGTLTLNGTGGGSAPNFGVSIEQAAVVGSIGIGSVVINGGTNGITMNPFGSGSGALAVGTGTLSLVGDVIDLGAPGSVTATGPGSTLLIQSATGSRPISLGAGNSATALVFSNATAAAISGFGQVTLNGGSGNITTGGALGPLAFALVVRNLSNTTGGIVIGHTLDTGTLALTLQTSAAITRSAGGVLRASELTLRAITGVGTSAAPLAIQTGRVGAQSSTGGLFLSSTSDVSVGTAAVPALLATVSGDIVLESTGFVRVVGVNRIVTNGGNIRVTGTTTEFSPGVHVFVGTIDAQGGDVSLTGTSLAPLTEALSVQGGKVQTRGGGKVSLSGTGHSGVQIRNGGTVSTVDGLLSITGNSPDTNNVLSHGVEIEEDSTVQATGVGGVTIVGTGSPNATRSAGVALRGTVSVNNGPLSITGTAKGTDDTNVGVAVESGVVRSTGAGSITIQGTATAGTPAIDFVNGPVNLGRSSGALRGGSGAVTLTGDIITLKDPGSISGTGNLILGPLTPSRLIQVGGAADDGKLVITDTNLAAIAPGFSLVAIGTVGGSGLITTGAPLAGLGSTLLIATDSPAAPGITISHSLDAGAHDLFVATLGALSIGSGAVLKASGKTLSLQGSTINVGNATLNAGPVAGGRVVFNGNTTLSPGTTLAVVLPPAGPNGPAPVEVRGSINLGGASLQATGPGGLPLGATITLISNDGAEAVTGTFAQGTSLIVAGEGLQLLYAAGDGNDVVALRPVPSPPARPVVVKLVRKKVGKARNAKRVLFLNVSFTDNAQLKSEIPSPFQAPRFKSIRLTTADTNQDGVIDSVTLSGKQGREPARQRFRSSVEKLRRERQRPDLPLRH